MSLEAFCVVPPGLEPVLAEEARALGFTICGQSKGGITISGDWPEIWRANLALRGATRVLVRLAQFPAVHLAQLDKRARKLPWADWLTPGLPVRIEAASKRSKIYHGRAAAERIAGAIAAATGNPVSTDAPLTLKLRIEDNLCTLSVDTSGEALYKRGHKQAVNKAPMRETLAALLLRASGYDGQMPLYDPMCGSGTFVIEGAEMATGLLPGRARRFAFEDLASFDAGAFAALKSGAPVQTDARCFGSDRDTGAITMSRANAERAGVGAAARFEAYAISEARPPSEVPGLVITNPPYGGRIGNKKPLFGLYASFGETMQAHFKGWRVAFVTSSGALAKATGLPLEPPGPSIDHGGIRIRLYRAQL